MAEYYFTFKSKKKRKPSEEYEGMLKNYRFYIEYYTQLNGEPKISFPVRFIETILNFSKDLGGEIKEIRKVKLSNGSYYEKPTVVLPNEISFRRHLLFSLTASTYRKPGKLSTLRNLVLDLNANFLNVLTNMAIERYAELKTSGNPAWVWYVLRVGRAVKTLYRMD